MMRGRERREQERKGVASGFSLLPEAEQDAAVVELLRGGPKTFIELYRALPGAGDDYRGNLHSTLLRLMTAGRAIVRDRRSMPRWELP